MRPGPAPKPTHLKLLQDNPGKRPLNDLEPQPELKIPDAPDWLTGQARACWDTYSELLHKNKVLSELDGMALAMLCQAFQRWLEAESYIAKQGMVLLSPTGFPMMNPYLAIAQRAMDQIHGLLAEFGMTPAARSRVKVAWKGQASDPNQRDFDFY